MNIRLANNEDFDRIKKLAEECHYEKGLELGFITGKTLETFINREGVLIAEDAEQLLGFVAYWVRRDFQVTIHHMIVEPNSRLQGIGRKLVDHLKCDSEQLGKSLMKLKCPVNLPANEFYRYTGWSLVEQVPGKRRVLNVWELDLEPNTKQGVLF